MTTQPEVSIRRARPSDFTELLSILDGAALETDSAVVQRAIDADRAFVTVSDSSRTDSEILLGGVVLRGEETVSSPDCRNGASGSRAFATACSSSASAVEISAIAVRPGRRGQGIGTALIEAVCSQYAIVRATFDPELRPFYESLGFSCRRCEEQSRLVGIWRDGAVEED